MKLRMICISVATIALALAFFPGLAFAANPPPTPPTTAQTDICAGVDAVSPAANGTSNCATNGTSAVGNIVHTVLNVLSFFVGLTAVIMIIVGGFRYITSGGDSSKASSARTTIVYAVVGLVFVVLAQVIVQFVLTSANPAKPTTGTVMGIAERKL